MLCPSLWWLRILLCITIHTYTATTLFLRLFHWPRVLVEVRGTCIGEGEILSFTIISWEKWLTPVLQRQKEVSVRCEVANKGPPETVSVSLECTAAPFSYVTFGQRTKWVTFMICKIWHDWMIGWLVLLCTPDTDTCGSWLVKSSITMHSIQIALMHSMMYVCMYIL